MDTKTGLQESCILCCHAVLNVPCAHDPDKNITLQYIPYTVNCLFTKRKTLMMFYKKADSSSSSEIKYTNTKNLDWTYQKLII